MSAFDLGDASRGCSPHKPQIEGHSAQPPSPFSWCGDDEREVLTEKKVNKEPEGRTVGKGRGRGDARITPVRGAEWAAKLVGCRGAAASAQLVQAIPNPPS